MDHDLFLKEVEQCPTPYHTVQLAKEKLLGAGYQEILETDTWTNLPSKFFVIQENISIIAVNIIDNSSAVILQSLTDTPTLISESQEIRQKANFEQILVSPHGNALWFSWLDKDIGLAGNVVTSEGNKLVHICPAGIIPSLAAHLNSGVGSKPKFDIKQNFNPVLNLVKSDHSTDLIHILANHLNVAPESIINYSLSVTDAQPPSFIGTDKAFISGHRLSVLSTAIPTLNSFLQVQPTKGTVILSITSTPNIAFLSRVLKTVLTPSVYRKTLFINVTNGRAKSPNFKTTITKENFKKVKNENPHDVHLGNGPVINWSPRSTYGTVGNSAATIKNIASKINVPISTYILPDNVVKPQFSEAAEAASLGLKSVEFGVPVLGADALRQLICIDDLVNFQKLVNEIIKNPPTIF